MFPVLLPPCCLWPVADLGKAIVRDLLVCFLVPNRVCHLSLSFSLPPCVRWISVIIFIMYVPALVNVQLAKKSLQLCMLVCGDI